MTCVATVFALAGCSGHNESPQPQSRAAASSPAHATVAAADTHAAVRKVVEHFGQQMQKVSTLAPPEAIRRELPAVYGAVLSPKLLADWKAHPDHAIGREGSSPWPARIEIGQIVCPHPDACHATGKVDYITSNEVAHGGVFMRRAIALQLARNGHDWRITAVRLQPARD